MQEISAEPVFLELWFTRIADATAAAEAEVGDLLGAGERERLARIGSSARQREYRLSRALMRHALGRRFGREPGDWVFDERERARPEIANLPAGIEFGLSHSKGLVCFALANRPLGIDLELAAAKPNFPALAKMFMNPAERARLARCDELRQADYFYRTWCAKEALYKLLPAAEQAVTRMAAIDYADLRRGEGGRRLYEGRIGGYAFAAAIQGRAATISCEYYLSSAAEIGELDLAAAP